MLNWSNPAKLEVCCRCKVKRMCLLLPDPKLLAEGKRPELQPWCYQCYDKRDREGLKK